MKPETKFIYKVVARSLWREAEARGELLGAEVDLTDGYIHFSTAQQLAETLQKHFAGQDDLLLIRVAATDLGADLKWEPSRGGALFPHLYAPLPLSAVRQLHVLLLDQHGRHVLPPGC